jgi:pyruvate ferredoxin oxidoreductase gamma subunit
VVDCNQEDPAVLRVRFHGRGGHGVKTASRILGTAAFQRGLYAQDCPLYGAERRGAPVAAYTRFDAGPVRERGVIADPDLILVADETLLADPAAAVLAGRDSASALFVNSPAPASSLAERLGLACPVIALDLTALTAECLGRGAALSAPLGAAACALAGVPLTETLEAVREELGEIGVGPDRKEANVGLARRVHGALEPVPLGERPKPSGAGALHLPVYVPPPAGMPVIVSVGNAAARHTGSWRLVRPTIDLGACTRCGVCFAFCPDGAVTPDERGYPVIDLDNCKGCMICRAVCPLRCIGEEREVRAW